MRRFWQRNKFHLSGLMLLVPLPFLPSHFTEKPVFAPAEIHRTLTAGPYVVGLVTVDQAPHRGPTGERLKDYSLRIRAGDVDGIRGAFLRVGKPRNLRTAGALAFGNPYERRVEVTVPEDLTGTEALWLSVERWDGTIHQASVPLAEILGGRR